jgi:hypothetical protein
MCLADRRALWHQNGHEAGFDLDAASDHSDLEATKEGQL